MRSGVARFKENRWASQRVGVSAFGHVTWTAHVAWQGRAPARPAWPVPRRTVGRLGVSAFSHMAWLRA